jgi:hypothetical protein
MKTARTLLAASVLIPVLVGSTAALEEKKDAKSPLPGNATWELKAFNSLFRVIRTDYDAETRKVKWTVETKNGHRTSDFVNDITRRPFSFRFLDGAMRELALVELFKDDFRGIPDTRLMKEGTRLTITLEVPRVIAKTKTVILQRGRP